MNILIFIKQVPDTTDIRIDPETNTLIRSGVKSVINPFDMYAIEEGIRLKERLGTDIATYVISMGPPQAEEAIREALSMGVDKGILLTDRRFAGSDTFATSYTLSLAAQKIGNFLLILTGKQASDGDTAQVGPGISEWLNIPLATYVRKIREIHKEYAIVERMTEEGYTVVKIPLPAVFTVVKEINEPRLPSIRGKLRAKKANVEIWNADILKAQSQYIGLNGSPTRVIKAYTPPARQRGELFQGNIEDGIRELLKKLLSLIHI